MHPRLTRSFSQQKQNGFHFVAACTHSPVCSKSTRQLTLKDQQCPADAATCPAAPRRSHSYDACLNTLHTHTVKYISQPPSRFPLTPSVLVFLFILSARLRFSLSQLHTESAEVSAEMQSQLTSACPRTANAISRCTCRTR